MKHINMKWITTSLFLLLLAPISNAQNPVKGSTSNERVLNYFIPSENNKALYKWFEKDGGMGTCIYYIDKKGSYELMEINYNGEFDAISKDKVISIFTSNVTISSSTVVENYMISTTPSETNVKSVWATTKYILKMPKPKQKESWSWSNIPVGNNGQNAEINKCTAEWTVVTVDGQSKKAIMVTTKICDSKGKALTEDLTIDYYVEGIGFWKQDIKSAENVTNMKKLYKISYDPNVNK